jgi:hypothetical protein
VDSAHLSLTFVLAAVGIGLGRFVLTSMDRAESGFASLWVPPDRTLGWPHGVQESDEPWAWRKGPPPIDVHAAPPFRPPIDADVPRSSEPASPLRDSLVVPVAAVAPVHLTIHRHEDGDV